MVFCGFSFKAFLLGVSCTCPMYLGDLFFVTKLYISFFVYPKKKRLYKAGTSTPGPITATQ